MQFRFNPRQLGLFRKGKGGQGARGGQGDLYDDKDPVTRGEIDHIKNSKTTPYKHKNTVAGAVPVERIDSGVSELINNKAVTPYRHKINGDPPPQEEKETVIPYGLVSYDEFTPYNRGKGGGVSAPEQSFKDTFVKMVRGMNVTPYQHKPDDSAGVPDGAHESHTSDITGRIVSQAVSEAAVNAEIKENAAGLAAEVDEAVPKQYIDEPRGGLFGRLKAAFGFEGNRETGLGRTEISELPANNSLGTDADGKVLFKDDIISMLTSELQRRRAERLPLELQWQLNSNFYDGNQYCDINPACNEIMQYPRCYEWEQREIFNRIAPLIETRVANLKKINYSMTVEPATNETDDYQKAQVSTAILRHTQGRGGFNMKKDSLILWNELCGSCFWLTWWDSTKGEVYSRQDVVFEDAQGQSAAREREVCEGDVDYGLLTPYEVYPESIFKQTVADQRSIIVEQVKTIDEIENLYGIRVEPTEVESFTLTPVPAAGGLGYEATVMSMGKAKLTGCQKVVTYFERSSGAYPRGRMAILVGDKDLVYYGAMPYDEIPLVRTVCKERAGQFFGKSVIEELIPLQRAYNNACNDIAGWVKMLKSPEWWVLQGSVDVDEFEQHVGEPGAIHIYRTPGDKPRSEQSVQFTGEVFTQKYDLERQMEYVAAVSQLMVYGETPSGVTSGKAIESLRDIDNTRLALTGDYIRSAVLEMAKIWLTLYKRYASTYRVIRYTGKNGIGSAVVWSNQDITSYDVEFSTENELMFSGDAQWQRAIQLLTAGVQDKSLYDEVVEQIRTYIKAGVHNSELTINELQEQAAVREFVFLREGVLPTVKEIDDNVIHAKCHLKDLLQLEFQLMEQDSPETYNYALSHYNEHIARLRQAAQANGPPINDSG
jgi:hypothetical protein